MSYKLRKRPDRSEYWYAIIRAPDGRTIERSTKCVRKTEADAVATKWDRDAALSRHQVSCEQAFELLREKMIDKGNSEATFEILHLKVAHVLGYFGRERAVDTIELVDTLGYMRHRRKKGVSDSTIIKELGYLRSALRHLRRLKKYEGDPLDIWPGDELTPGAPRKRWLTMPEYERLLLAMGTITGYFRAQTAGKGWRREPGEATRVWVDATVAAQDWREHVIAYVYSGARLSELLRIEALHCNFASGEVAIPGTKTEGADRVIPMHTELRAVLERRAELHPTGPLFPSSSPDEDAHARAWLRALRKGCERAQIEHASTNDLRRTFCSWAFQAGVPEAVCVRWMGHASARMVREVYAQMSPEQGRAEIDKMPSPSRRTSHVSPTASSRSGRLVATQSNPKPGVFSKRRLNG